MQYRLGWHRDLPDHRDYSPHQEGSDVDHLLRELPKQDTRSDSVDWREFCANVGDQQSLNASPAFACVGLLQYFERRAFGTLLEPSKLFAYKTARRLLGWQGDSGAQLRATWKAIVNFGVPHESGWPYDTLRVDDEPDAFAYAAARRSESFYYLRLDGRGNSGDATLEQVKSFLAAGFACAFGFPVVNTLSSDGEIPMPSVFDIVQGGQTAVAVGYDDLRRFRSNRGALLIRNSWGKDWGEQGYGWLPYAYVREQLAVDFWTVVSRRWLKSGEFFQP